MKKILVATTTLSLMCGSVFAQGTGPAAQPDNMTKPGMEKGMQKGGMEKGPMNNGTPATSGMGNGGTRPDPSGQGGSGPDSDQGGTRVTPGNTK
jgi:hypothetical protein